jgi:hypothetical protein
VRGVTVFEWLSIWHGVALGVVGAGLLTLWKRRPSHSELVAILEISEQAKLETTQALSTLSEVRTSGKLERLIRRTSDAIEATTQRHLDGVESRTELAFDNEFYGKSLKAVFPKESWRTEYQAYADRAVADVMDAQGYSRELESHTEGAIKSLARDIDAAIPHRELSILGEQGLETLANQPERRERFLGENSLLNESIRARSDLNRAMVLGGGTAGVGLALPILTEIVGPELTVTIASSAAGLLAHSNGNIIEFVTEHIGQLVVQEVGEEAIMEVMEAVGAALTGIGIVYTLWKGVKYMSFIKRFVIDKEPLQHVRAAMIENTIEAMNHTGEELKREIDRQLRHVISECESRLSELQSEAAEREIWAARRLGVA